MSRITVYVTPNKNLKKQHKYEAFIVYPDGKTKTVKFGHNKYEDYTIHKDNERMKRYLNRHRSREKWGKKNIDTAGFWSRWFLWSEPSIPKARKLMESKFNIKIYMRKPPKSLLSPTKSSTKKSSAKKSSAKKSSAKKSSTKKSSTKKSSTKKSSTKKSSAKKSSTKSGKF